MKSKKGFTLIELLAIIVILAVIAVITVPIILNIVEDASKSSVVDSAYGYKDGIQNYSAYLQAVNPNNPGIKGSYTVTELKTAGLKVTGKEPSEGIVLVDDEGVSGCLQFDEYASYLYNNKVINTLKAICPTQKLVTTGDGLYKSNTDPGRMIFRGENPNNKIFLKEDGTNNTLYRIVSYEPDGTVKVVRDEKLSADMAWDEKNVRNNNNNTFCKSTQSCSAWAKGSDTFHDGVPLGDSYHYYFYDSGRDIMASREEYLSGTVTSNSTLNTYLNNTWLSNALSNYIDNHSWNVGGLNTTKGILLEKAEERQHTWTGKVALLSLTEYAESSTNQECTDAMNYTGCKESNWLIKNYNQWTLTVNPLDLIRDLFGDDRVYYISDASRGNASTYTNCGVRPSFYLKSGLSLSGTGASSSEYIITGM